MGGGRRGVGESRLPRAPQCGDFYCGAPALCTHARKGGPRAPSPAQGGATAPRRLAGALRHARTAGLPGCHPPSPDPVP